jgi:hypothetical protein
MALASKRTHGEGASQRYFDDSIVEGGARPAKFQNFFGSGRWLAALTGEGDGVRRPAPSTTRSTPMSNNSLSRSSLLLLASLCTLLPGCDVPEDYDTPAVEVTDVDGLTLKILGNRVEGSFTRDEATIDFVIEGGDEIRTAVLTASDGSPLLESVAEAGHETVTVLGGRAVLSGDPRSPEPNIEGDRHAYDELRAMPEATCIRELHAALTEAGVDPVLLGAESVAQEEVNPRLYNDGTWWVLGPKESILVGTWGWLTYTNISVRWDYVPPVYNPVPWALPLPTCVRFQAGFGGWSNICVWANSQTTQAYQFWGRSPDGGEPQLEHDHEGADILSTDLRGGAGPRLTAPRRA